MIEFKGEISGEAKQYHKITNQKFFSKVLGIACVITTPFAVTLCAFINAWGFIPCYFGICGLFLLIMRFTPHYSASPFLPYLITITVDDIIIQSQKVTTERYIEDVKQVIDYGTFYAVSFPFRKTNHDCICQKKLLVQGTLEEFEALFEGKIIRKIQE